MEKNIEVEKIDIIFDGMDVTVLLNDQDYTEHIKKIVIDLQAKTKEDRIEIVLHPAWWPEVKATFK